ncbi:Geranylgeranyl pyrophosphate synthase [Desmophyllum pertusum]|uniref:Geranylgeranyl pyrophosphate synthase n=1 Tax=Desmophyllum pertusum TaxID=174260 RepID=A0A9W9YQ85_9CNID|nr:Geranylgeranyl pyrophosphate synthase [Desmophyllum pertusum]
MVMVVSGGWCHGHWNPCHVRDRLGSSELASWSWLSRFIGIVGVVVVVVPLTYSLCIDVFDETGIDVIIHLKQRTTDIDIKKYFVDYLEQVGSFAYTKVVLKELEKKSQELIADLGDNPHLSAVVVHLAKLYS